MQGIAFPLISKKYESTLLCICYSLLLVSSRPVSVPEPQVTSHYHISHSVLSSCNAMSSSAKESSLNSNGLQLKFMVQTISAVIISRCLMVCPLQPVILPFKLKNCSFRCIPYALLYSGWWSQLLHTLPTYSFYYYSPSLISNG